MKKQVFLVFFLISISSFAANKLDGFLGSWNTTFGVMKLENSGDNRLKGVYILSQQPCQIEGRLENNGQKFVFTYRESQASGEG